jgi:Fe-S cluster assembly iron-binding protein IscA
MLEVTDKASEKLKQYMDDKQIESAIRIYASHVG